MIDILDLETDVAMHVRTAVADVALNGHRELIGRLVQELINAGVLNADNLRNILPLRYQVRE